MWHIFNNSYIEFVVRDRFCLSTSISNNILMLLNWFNYLLYKQTHTVVKIYNIMNLIMYRVMLDA